MPYVFQNSANLNTFMLIEGQSRCFATGNFQLKSNAYIDSKEAQPEVVASSCSTAA
jgi:hypothetical protein